MPLYRPIVLALSTLSMLAACGAQVDSDHQGDVLARLGGTVHSQRTLSTPDAEVALVWENAGEKDRIGGEAVDLEGQFPTMFRLTLYVPPDESLINRAPDGSQIGVAYIFAARQGTDYAHVQDADILGMDPDHLLIYLPRDVAPGSLVATLLHGTPRAGFHLVSVHHLTDEEKQQRGACRAQLPPGYTTQQLYQTCGGSPSFDDLLPASGDLDAPLQVELVDDLAQLDVPNWT